MGKLEAYWRKRHFEETQEPSGKIIERRAGKPLFVVQHHWAKTEHYDFRLEIEGVLESWAVPKGPPQEIGIKRLAIMTEPHPISYSSWQGTIPEGQYGAGTVEIWDKGDYELIEKTSKKLVFNLQGKKLKGNYTLLLFKLPKNWLLFRNSEALD